MLKENHQVPTVYIDVVMNLYSFIVIDVRVHVCVSRMCECVHVLKNHALTEDDVNQR